ncbi:hypothetical protein [Alkalicoccus chagannorensis]|uniref:hypothetical protein n=1 Tax=Alkalicoccus chagannorensis TaxID=427072 RepID=UPI000404037D|nr:hypothetical protein [Alkalicoccus chagannorensis]
MDNREEKIIQSFQQDEQMMAMVFVQYCINQALDPVEIYRRAYGSTDSTVLHRALELAVSKEEAGPIEKETLYAVLSMYGNEALAEEIEKTNRKEE